MRTLRGLWTLSLLGGAWCFGCGGSGDRDAAGDEGSGDELCAADSVIIASEQPASFTSRIAIDGAHAYWTYGIMIFDAVPPATGTVTRAPLAGGAPTAVASEQHVPTAIALGASDVFWIEQFGGDIMKAPKTGGAPTRIASFNGNILELEVDDESVYWLAYDDGGPGVFKASVGGGDAVRLATGEGQVEALVVDDTHVYWADHVDETGVNRVMKAPIDGGEPVVLHSQLFGNAYPDLAVGPSGVYWDGDYGDDIGSDGFVSIRLMQMPLAGGAPVLIAEEPSIGHVAVNSKYVYWTAGVGGSAGAIRKAPLSGGEVSTVVSDQVGLTAFAVDDSNVCWLTFGNGAASGDVTCRKACD